MSSAASVDEPVYPYTFDAELRRKARFLSAKLFRASVVSSAFETSLLMLVTFGGPGAWLGFALMSFPWFMRAAMFSALLVLIFYVGSMPFAYWIHSIRSRNGITTAGAGKWLADSLKVLFLSAAVAAGASVLLFALMMLSGFWWLLAATAYVLFVITYSRFIPLLALRFFRKLSLLEGSETHHEITSLLRSLSLEELDIYVMNESSRSRIANAFVAGIGKNKKIVLFDNLIRLFTPREARCIAAHELGHYLAGDSFRSMLSQILISYASAYLLYIVYGMALRFHSIYSPEDPYILLLFSATLTITGAALAPLRNYLSRRRERRADMFSLESCKDPVAFISGEKRLCDINLMDDNPPLLRRILFATHPSTAERVLMGEQWHRSVETVKES